MSKPYVLTTDQKRLADAWQKTLPETLHGSDKAEVVPDESDEKALRIHVQTAGHSMYSFDFKVEYVDSREIKVELIDVEKAGRTVDERNETVQQLVEDYVRHIHECAQTLHRLTHS